MGFARCGRQEALAVGDSEAGVLLSPCHPPHMSKLSKWDGWVLAARLTLLHVAGVTNHLHM
jgi:hypothetical protein